MCLYINLTSLHVCTLHTRVMLCAPIQHAQMYESNGTTCTCVHVHIVYTCIPYGTVEVCVMCVYMCVCVYVCVKFVHGTSTNVHVIIFLSVCI